MNNQQAMMKHDQHVWQYEMHKRLEAFNFYVMLKRMWDSIDKTAMMA